MTGGRRVVVAGLVTLLGGCGEAAPCEGDADCGGTQMCVWGVCIERAQPLSPGVPSLADPWGERWDPVHLGPVSFAEATAACEARGARLPTATEVFRGRGEGPEPFFLPGDALWTLAPTIAPGTRAVVAPGSGAVVAADEGEQHPFRCVAPRREAAPHLVFDAGFCHGPPGEPCVQHHVWRADRWDRPALDAAGAAFECAFVNAGLPSLREVQEVAQGSGWGAPTGHALWSADVVATSDRVAVATWRAEEREVDWAWGDARGGHAAAAEPHPFRCLGRAQVEPPFEPTALHCLEGRCAESRRGRFRLTADAAHREPDTDWSSAQGVCQYLGGWLPSVAEARQLFQDGWASDAPYDWLWTSDVAVGGPSNLRQAVRVRRGAAHPERWSPTKDTVAVAPLAVSASVRCVWTERRFERLRRCPPGTVQTTDAGRIGCSPYTAGTSCDDDGCRGLGGEGRDEWGAAWDARSRPPLPWADAAARCAALGARLPTLSELGRVGAGPEGLWLIDDPLPLWSMTPTTGGRRMLLSSEGRASVAPVIEAHPYRCIWPGPPTGTLGRGTCQGRGLAPCHQYMQVRMDALRRPAVPHAVAAWECSFIGARLPTAREVMQASRAPTARDLATWLVDPLLAADGSRVYAVADGDGPWAWTSPADGLLDAEQPWPFHCVTTGGPE